MKPSFFSSTLSIAFLISILSIVAMAFYGITPDDKLLSIISGVIGAYIGARIPNANDTNQKG